MDSEKLKNNMKVTFVCHSDLLGGASVVTYRLMQALRSKGVEARMIVYTKLGYDDSVSLISSRFMRGVRFSVERMRILLSNGLRYDNLFKVSIANTGCYIHRHPWIKEADVVVLAWINQGLMSLDGIERVAELGKPIVWIMHDMWNVTGICHHAYECERFIGGECGKCPFLCSNKEQDLSHSVWIRKRRLYDNVAIRFVAVSTWLANLCAKSSLLHDKPVEVIPNAFPADSFVTELKGDYPSLSIDYSRDLIIMGAARLDDPIKGIDYAIDALNRLFDNYPQVAKKSYAVFFGGMKHPEIFDRLRFPYMWVGMINDTDTLRKLYSCSKVVLSSSLYETLPGTLIEGIAAGCLAVTFGRGGQNDIVTHKVDGYIACYKDSSDLAAGIMWALEQNTDREALHDMMKSKFSASNVAERYIELFDSVLRDNEKTKNSI